MRAEPFLEDIVGERGEQHLAHPGGVRLQAAPDGRVEAEHVLPVHFRHIEHLEIVEDGELDGFRREIAHFLQDRLRARLQRHHRRVGGAGFERAHAECILACRVELEPAGTDHGLQQAVQAGLGEVEGVLDLGELEPTPAARQQLQDLQGP